jgi:hypothetical protein
MAAAASGQIHATVSVNTSTFPDAPSTAIETSAVRRAIPKLSCARPAARHRATKSASATASIRAPPSVRNSK